MDIYHKLQGTCVKCHTEREENWKMMIAYDIFFAVIFLYQIESDVVVLEPNYLTHS